MPSLVFFATSHFLPTTHLYPPPTFATFNDMHNFKTILTSSLFLFALFIIPASTNAQVIVDSPTNFITTWNTENSGTSANNQITIPGTGVGYNYEIYWEDTASSTINGTTTLITTASHTLTFPAPGIYEVQIAGDFPRIYFNGGGDKDKILTVEQWGNIAWTSVSRAFLGASNLRVPATDAPDLSGVTSLSLMFSGAGSFNDAIDHWDVSTIISFDRFLMGTPFNQPLNSWNTASATNMFRMFRDASAFNQDISMWDVSNVTQMTQMFRNTPFNQPIGAWDTGSLQFTVQMFAPNTAFDQDLSNWDISSIQVAGGGWTANGMNGMFYNTQLSTANLDATLESWATQATNNNITNIPLRLGVKSYTQTGATAIATLRNLGWTITEQYKAEYYPSANAALFGDNVQTGLNLGDTTTEVTLTPKSNCTFIQWSDGSTSNPRTDTIGTSNINVTAELSCSSSGSATRATTQRDRSRAYGNEANAQMIEERFLTSSTTPTARQTPTTIEESLDEVRAVSATIDQIVAADSSPETIRTLIAILLSLIEILTRLMVIDEVSG